jgi:hypothetical protein
MSDAVTQDRASLSKQVGTGEARDDPYCHDNAARRSVTEQMLGLSRRAFQL